MEETSEIGGEERGDRADHGGAASGSFGFRTLVNDSLAANPLTVVTIFVNPTQFAPHEDLASYPRTMGTDLKQLEGLLSQKSRPNKASLGRGLNRGSDMPSRTSIETEVESDTGAESSSATFPSAYPTPGQRHKQPTPPLGHNPPSTTSASELSTERPPSNDEYATDEPQIIVFAPSQSVMYPLTASSSVPKSISGDATGGTGMLQDTNRQRGAFVEVKGWGDVMEGRSRPQFFRGVATVCTKLFNAVEPDHAYFGQKDIQQALILKIMLRDLLSAYPEPDNLHIIPTTRDPDTNLALSSRNAYLSEKERSYASTLYQALSSAREMLSRGGASGREAVERARNLILERVEDARKDGVEIKLDYIELFDKNSFASLVEEDAGSEGSAAKDARRREAVISGAMWVGKTRLIDNLLIGWEC